MGDVDACSCGGVGCDTCSKYGRTMGMHNAPTSDGSYGGGLTNTGMAMPLFARGVACNGPSCGIGTGRLRGALSSLAGCKDGCSTEEESCDECEVASGGLLGKLREANAIAIAEQEAAFDAAQAESGCGPGGCGGRLGGCGCGGAGTCAACLKGIAQYYHGHPYGGAVPHTTPPPAGAGASGAGMAPTYAYPYYTTRGPRDFLSRRPMDIGY